MGATQRPRSSTSTSSCCGPAARLECHRRYEFWWKYDSFGQFLAHWFDYESME